MEVLTTDIMMSAGTVRSLNESATLPSPEAYTRLPEIDRDHASSLARTCHLSSEARDVSRMLANCSSWQSLATSAPLVVADFVTIWALLFAVTTIFERVFSLPTTLVTRDTAFIASLLLVPIARLKGLYPAIGTTPAVEFREIVQSVTTAVCIFVVIGVVTVKGHSGFFFASTVATILLAVPIFPAVRYVVRALASKCSWWGAPVAVYGRSDIALELVKRLRLNRERGLHPVAVFLSTRDHWESADEFARVGIPAYDVRQALECTKKHLVTWLIVGATDRGKRPNLDLESEIQADLNAIPNRVLLTTDGIDCGMWDRTHTIGSASGLWFTTSRHSYIQECLKRFIDISATAMIGLFFSPLVLAIAIAIRCSSPGPIFYSQKRIGRGGKMFSAWKFRSMVCNAEQVLQKVLDSDPDYAREWQETHKLKRDPRVTWIGRLIRSTSLDELPQLWNILAGDMSLVGPRPIVDSPNYDATYIRDYPREYAAYCSVRPGLTGLWQVTCRNSGVYEMRIYWDLYYIRNWSIWIDIYIILRTIRTVLLREGGS